MKAEELQLAIWRLVESVEAKVGNRALDVEINYLLEVAAEHFEETMKFLEGVVQKTTKAKKIIHELGRAVDSMRLDKAAETAKRRKPKNGTIEKIAAIKASFGYGGKVDWKKACDLAAVDYDSASELAAFKKLWKRRKGTN